MTPDTRFEFGICDVAENYHFYFKWLLSKIMDVIVLENVPETIDVAYLKQNLLLNGEICITDFNDKLYACIGSRGGAPNEYYRPTQFIIANPILGSKVVDIDKNGVVVYNTAADKSPYWFGGLWQLVKQTATLLADNIVSINCAQINCRVEAIFTADSEGQAAGGEAILKRIYQGHPYQIVRQNMIEKININPMSTSNSANKIRELIELHQYIIAQFFQAVGIKSNAINKKERLITDEINSQDDYLAVSLVDIAASWQEGFDKVNEMYGTNIQVKINPILEHILEDSTKPEEVMKIEQESNEEITQNIEETEKTEEKPVTTAKEVIEEAMDKVEGGESNEYEPQND